MELKKSFWRLRRYLLKKLVPEMIWPTHVTYEGVEVPVRHQPYSFGTKRLLTSGNYEAAERRLLRGVINPGDTIIEMGASIGVLTAILSAQTGPMGKVISIEASKKLVTIARAWLSERGNVTIEEGFAFPVFACSGNIKVKKFDEVYGSLGSIVEYRFGEGASPHESVIFDLKKICEVFNIKPDILIADVEGSEKIIVETGPAFPASLKWILIELHPRMYGEEIRQQIIDRFTLEHFVEVKKENEVYLFKRR